MTSNLLERDPAVDTTVVTPAKQMDKQPHSPTASSFPTPTTQAGWSIMTWVTICILLVAAFGGGWWFANNQANHHERMSLPKSDLVLKNDAIVVTTEPIVYRDVQRYVEAVGTLNGFEEITLSSKQEGRVLRIHHDLSSIVKPGELLLELDPTDAKLAYDQANRNVQTELAKWGFKSVPDESEDLQQLPTVVSARLRFELAQSRLTRMTPLKASNSVSAEDWEQAKSDVLVQQSEWQNQLLMANSAAATARLRNAELAIADQRIKDISIRAPLPTILSNPADHFYTISERLVSEGTLVRPGTEVFKLVLGKTLKLRLSIPEAYSRQVMVGQTVDLVTGASQKASIGTIERIAPSIDRTTRTFVVEVTVPNQDGFLKPGGFAKAKILVGKDTKATTIPIHGLYSFAGLNKVFLNENGVAKEFKVKLGEQTDEWVEIVEPALPANGSVVTSGQKLLSEGSSISLRSNSKEVETETVSPAETGAR